MRCTSPAREAPSSWKSDWVGRTGPENLLSGASYNCAVGRSAATPGSELVADRPEVREHRKKQRLLQELNTKRSPGATFAADGPLHQFNVAITPFLEPLVKVRHQLEKDLQVRLVLVELQKARFHRFVRNRRQGDVAGP